LALLASSDLASELPATTSAVVVDRPHAALTALLPLFHPERAPDPGVHPTAVIGRGVQLGDAVSVGPYAVVDEGTRLGDRVRVGAHTVIGRACDVGDDTLLHPRAVLYDGTVLGRRVIVHSGAVLGSDGFGYAFEGGAYRKIPQVGGCRVGDDVEIGANSCIDRGSIGDTVVGQGTKLDNLVHLAHNVRVGANCAMAAQVGIAGSTRIGDGAAFGGQSGAVGHIEVGAGARVGAQSGVLSDLAAGMAVAGHPAREVKAYLKGSALMMRLPELRSRVRALEKRLGGAAEPAGEAD
jgi:UDP-3-O-[3-hydroxymyristoyl] glucosamine N-acyltransferase